MILEHWWYGVAGFSLPILAAYVLLMTHVTIVGVTVYLHISPRTGRWNCTPPCSTSSGSGSG